MSEQPKNTAEPNLEGRVAQLLNARELVINIGAKAGVKPGMKFAVLSETPLEIVDPGTKEVLDTVDRQKVRVEAHEVRPRVSICRTYRTRTTPGWRVGALEEMLRRSEEVVETLRAEDSALPPPLSPEDSYVKINDRVVRIDE
jgi:hypothetical protein